MTHQSASGDVRNHQTNVKITGGDELALADGRGLRDGAVLMEVSKRVVDKDEGPGDAIHIVVSRDHRTLVPFPEEEGDVGWGCIDEPARKLETPWRDRDPDTTLLTIPVIYSAHQEVDGVSTESQGIAAHQELDKGRARERTSGSGLMDLTRGVLKGHRATLRNSQLVVPYPEDALLASAIDEALLLREEKKVAKPAGGGLPKSGLGAGSTGAKLTEGVYLGKTS
jgi:hypothetical protein